MHEAKIAWLSPTEITVRSERVTPLNPHAVSLLRQSVEETCQIRDPIHVRKVKSGHELIDGRHRLEVALELGHDAIAARVWDCTLAQARLMEADANVTFTHMDPVDLAVSLAKRKKAYIDLHPETAHGVAGALAKHGMQRTEMSFADFVSDVVGVSERQIRRIISAGEALDESDVVSLRNAPNRVSMNDLYDIAKIIDDGERAFVVRSLSEGGHKKAAAARRAYVAQSSGTITPPKDPVDEVFKDLLTRWRRAPKAARRRFVAEVMDDIAALGVVSGGDA